MTLVLPDGSDTQPPRPIPASYWVHPDHLLAGEYPGAPTTAVAHQKLCAFLDAGITLFVDLTEDRELVPYAALLHEEASARGIRATHRRVPIRDATCPTRREMVQVLDMIEAALHAGERVYVHCWGGVGRTGTVIGCYLVRQGLTGKAALHWLKQRMQTTSKSDRRSPETEAQHSMVYNWQVPCTGGGGQTIRNFTAEWYVLSNYYYPAPARLDDDGITYPTSEHAYQAAKFAPGSPQRADILRAPSSDHAKRLGKQAGQRADWEAVRVAVMRQVLASKFADPTLAARLLATGSAHLEEGNTWCDRFWGVCYCAACGGQGANQLGTLLMELRAALRGDTAVPVL